MWAPQRAFGHSVLRVGSATVYVLSQSVIRVYIDRVMPKIWWHWQSSIAALPSIEKQLRNTPHNSSSSYSSMSSLSFAFACSAESKPMCPRGTPFNKGTNSFEALREDLILPLKFPRHQPYHNPLHMCGEAGPTLTRTNAEPNPNPNTNVTLIRMLTLMLTPMPTVSCV